MSVLSTGHYAWLAWTNEGLFATAYSTADSTTLETEMVLVTANGDEGVARDVNTGCRVDRLGAISTTLQGNLVYNSECLGAPGAQEQDRYDLHIVSTGGAGQKVATLEQSPGPVGWNEEAAQGIGSFSVRPCGYLIEIGPQGGSPLAMESLLDGERWGNDPSRQASIVDGCSNNEASVSPAMSLDAERIAYFGRAPGEEGWSLFVGDLDAGEAEAIVTDIASPGQISWAPDETLAFTADLGDGFALWTMRASEEEPRFLAPNASMSLAWSPDGHSLAATILQHPGEVTAIPDVEIRVFQVSNGE